MPPEWMFHRFTLFALGVKDIASVTLSISDDYIDKGWLQTCCGRAWLDWYYIAMPLQPKVLLYLITVRGNIKLLVRIVPHEIRYKTNESRMSHTLSPAGLA